MRPAERRYRAVLEKAAAAGLAVEPLADAGGELSLEEISRRNACIREVARIIGSAEAVGWLEELTMAALDELKRDPVFIEDVKDMLKDSIRATLRSKDFQAHVAAQCREATSGVAVDEIAAHDGEIKERVRALVDAELGPAVDRAIRAAIDAHVADVRRRSGL